MGSFLQMMDGTRIELKPGSVKIEMLPGAPEPPYFYNEGGTIDPVQWRKVWAWTEPCVAEFQLVQSTRQKRAMRRWLYNFASHGRRPRPSKGWRRHVRKTKAAAR